MDGIGLGVKAGAVPLAAQGVLPQGAAADHGEVGAQIQIRREDAVAGHVRAEAHARHAEMSARGGDLAALAALGVGGEVVHDQGQDLVGELLAELVVIANGVMRRRGFRGDIPAGGDDDHRLAQAAVDHIVQQVRHFDALILVGQHPGQPEILVRAVDVQQEQDVVLPLRCVAVGQVDVELLGKGAVGAVVVVPRLIAQGGHAPLLGTGREERGGKRVVGQLGSAQRPGRGLRRRLGRGLRRRFGRGLHRRRLGRDLLGTGMDGERIPGQNEQRDGKDQQQDFFHPRGTS